MDYSEYIKDFREELEKAEEENPRLWKTSVFMLKLLAVGLVFRAVLFFNPDTLFFQRQLAALTQQILQLGGYSFDLQGALLVGSPNSYLITRDCLGWKSMAAFIGLIFASSSEWRNEFGIIAAGVAGLALINLGRVVTTIVLSEAGIISFEIIHTFLWRWGMTALVLVFWYSWFTGRFGGITQGIFK